MNNLISSNWIEIFYNQINYFILQQEKIFKIFYQALSDQKILKFFQNAHNNLNNYGDDEIFFALELNGFKIVVTPDRSIGYLFYNEHAGKNIYGNINNNLITYGYVSYIDSKILKFLQEFYDTKLELEKKIGDIENIKRNLPQIRKMLSTINENNYPKLFKRLNDIFEIMQHKRLNMAYWELKQNKITIPYLYGEIRIEGNKRYKIKAIDNLTIKKQHYLKEKEFSVLYKVIFNVTKILNPIVEVAYF